MHFRVNKLEKEAYFMAIAAGDVCLLLPSSILCLVARLKTIKTSNEHVQ